MISMSAGGPLCAAVIAAILISLPASGVDLSDADRKAGQAQLERTRKGVLDATASLSPAQWTFQSAPDRWSVAQVLEHITVTEEALLQYISADVMKTPAAAPGRDTKALDSLVTAAIADRSKKLQAPKELAPTGRWTPEETLRRFQQNRQQTIDYLNHTQNLRDHVKESPLGQPLDAYEWLLYISAHSDRHTQQILEVKADPAFPKK
jgi:hypothetical protein